MNDYSEDALVEQPAIAVFAELGWQTVNLFNERFGPESVSTVGRETSGEVVLRPRLCAALQRLNPGLPREALRLAVETVTADRGALSPVEANREVYRLLKDGVKVSFRDDQGEEISETVRVIDWDDPARNDYLLASQLWVSGETYRRRADLVGFVNGLPLVFVELKATHKRLEDAYNNNLRDYKDSIPQLFWYNALIILSNGSKSRIGTMTASWEHFAEWKRINTEGETGVVSLDTMIRGTCEPGLLLDLVENFTLFSDAGGAPVKIIARNHQYLGVNNAVAALARRRDNSGRLGVFWHTQGSGKSYSMVFFAQKVLRKLPGAWTFLVVTDRQELDEQIYKTFAAAGAIVEPQREVQATSGEHLQRLLREDHRTVFTLIQKFRAERGATYPRLSERSDIVVITDEAHRSQYDTFAMNMRNALPHASFIGFTGTPLMAGEEKTREVFGDYVSIYNFKQSIDDGATVPLYYENRIPELQLTNDDLNQDMEAVIEAAELDDAQERKLEREFAREYHLITRDERLEKVAEDIVAHFMGRGQDGKAMVISIDKATAIRMCDKVRRYWNLYLARLRTELLESETDEAREELAARIAYMEETDMAVVVSQAQNEVQELRDKGLDIAPHRKRMLAEDLGKKFKDPRDPLRIVFVCAMWMTGFDVPSISTLYLDKPMRNHTLMQTIARANRVYGDKSGGVIVDYVGVFRDLQRALAIYGAATGGGAAAAETPIRDKAALVADLRAALDELRTFCTGLRIDPQAILDATGFARVRLLDDAVEAILAVGAGTGERDAHKSRYLALAAAARRLYRAVLPDTTANEFGPLVTLYGVLAAKLLSLAPEVDISAVMDDVARLLDESIAAEGYIIHDPARSYAAGGEGDASGRIDLSALDFDALKAQFAAGRVHTATEKLRGAVHSRLQCMVRANRSRADYLTEFQQLIDDYNSGALDVGLLFARLQAFSDKLDAEERRAIAENLTEEELAVFDLLTKPAMELTNAERGQVKEVAHELLETLKREKLVLDWRKRQQSRAQVRATIETLLDRRLPQAYTAELYQQKCDAIYQHIYDAYAGQGKSVYGPAA